MLEEINLELKKFQEKRKEKVSEVDTFMAKKKEDLLQVFEQAYAVAIEELAAKDGTGKKYGKPRRLAQERLRSEMTKCEKAQEAISANISSIKQLFEAY